MRRSPSPASGLSALLCIIPLLGGCDQPPGPTVSLERAVQVGDLEQLRRHLYWQSDLDQPDRNGDRPLHLAVRAGQVAMVRELATHGASLVAPNGAGQSPLELALVHGKTQVALELVARGAPLDPQALLLSLVRARVADRDSFIFLTRRGADLNRPGPHGQAPLHLAVTLAHLETVKRLIALGADLNQPDGNGKTPLTLALDLAPKTAHRAEIQSALQQAGARP